jgi:hypothetical protein
MNNSNKSEKSRGIIAFARNTETTDYVSIAKKTLCIASKTLNLPHMLITNVDDESFVNHRFDVDQQKFVEWRNYGRHLVYELSPYDETIVIDADYLLLDKNINSLFDIEWDYILQRNSHALTVEWDQKMGQFSLPYVWATIFAFRKTKKSEIFFKLIDRIFNNYKYYRNLFNIQERNYRNDYAFAMADIILNGYSVSTFGISGSMLSIDQPINSIKIKDNSLIVKDDHKSYVVPKTNLHIMSKKYLQSEDFDNLIKSINEPT